MRSGLLLGLLLLLGCAGGGRLAPGDEALLAGNPQGAVEAYRAVVGAHGDAVSAQALLRIARIQLDVDGQLTEGIRTLNELVTRFPGTEAAYTGQNLLVDVYWKRSTDPVALVQSALRAMDMKPGGARDPRLRRLLGEGYRLRGDLAQARIEWEELLQRYPEDPEAAWARLAIAETYELQGAVRKARSQYQKVEEATLGTEVAVAARLGRARTLETLDDLDGAEALYLECLAYSRNRDAVGARLAALRARRVRRAGQQ